MLKSLLSCAIFLTPSLSSSSSSNSNEGSDFGKDELILLRNEIRALITANEVGLNSNSSSVSKLDLIFPWDLPIIASSVRLAFHDCAGEFPTKCNGCIDVNSGANRGIMEGSIAPLSSICNSYKTNYNLSIGDCWSLAATFGLELSGELTYDDWTEINAFFDGGLDPSNDFPCVGIEPGDIPYYIGRIDCETTPDNEEGVQEELPRPPDSWQVIQHFFGDRFPMTNKEIVAIIAGGHSLGRGHSDATGHVGPWDLSSNTLDNAYAKGLLGENLLLSPYNWQFGRFAPGRGPSQFFVEDKFTDFGLPSDQALLMLPADISLAFNRSYYVENRIRDVDCMTRGIEWCDTNYPGTTVLYPGEDEDTYPEGTEFCPFKQCPIQCNGGNSELIEYILGDFENIDDDYDGCPVAWIQQFAMYNDELIDTFISAFIKLITSGYVILDESSSSDEDLYLDTNLDYLTEVAVDYDSLEISSSSG